MAKTTIAHDHQVWINYLQPEGLVISSLVLEDAQLGLPADLRELQGRYQNFVTDDPELPVEIKSWGLFTRDFLGWKDRFVLQGEAIPAELRLVLPEYNETLVPNQVLVGHPDQKPFVLVKEYGPSFDLEKDVENAVWKASPVRRMERLLRETGLAIGVVSNQRAIKLIYAPRGENAGVLTFPVDAMTQVMGRPILGALSLLLGVNALWANQGDQRLTALLTNSRQAQAKVSSELARQVLGALYELLRGFASAHADEPNPVLARWVAENPQGIYGGLLSVLMRLVFLLYTEDRGLMPATDVYDRSYSVHGLWAKLRNDAHQYPDTMDRRWGAWAQLLALFRVVYQGCDHPSLQLPPRWGHLFDPDRYPFLEGEGTVPPVSDGTIYRVLDSLLVLNGEKLSYRTLDVEQIGSVYEAVMGFEFLVVKGLSVAIRPTKSHGAAPIVDLEALVEAKPKDRKKVFKELTDRDLNDKTAQALTAAGSVDALIGLLTDLVDRDATPHPVAAGGWVLQPTDDRRRSGSHYTPRSLTAPIVEKALEPVWKRLGDRPTPETILGLKICDPAMGSGAFLVEACRQIADQLQRAWHLHDCVPLIPTDEDEVLHARRLVAQRCLYGVDRNPMAVDLAKLSLWLATLAKDHPFTFLDHNFRHGDTLVGLSLKQIKSFHWEVSEGDGFLYREMKEKIEAAAQIRRRILDAPEETSDPAWKANQLAKAHDQLAPVRLAADLVVSAWFSDEKDKKKKATLGEYANLYQWAPQKPEVRERLEEVVTGLRNAEKPILSFHWEVELPEVFAEGGFDAMVGNPPFAGKNTLAAGNHALYPKWIKDLHAESHGNADLVAHFFRRAFDLIKPGAAFGLIATNTIAQGDTRSSGLRYLCEHGGSIYTATKRLKWPGEAAVVVSVVHVQKTSEPTVHRLLDDKRVDFISAYLFYQGGHADPQRLAANQGKSFVGSYVLGMGFTFDDTDKKGVANTLAEMRALIAKDSKNAELIYPYIGGEEVNNSPTHAHHRYVINFGERTEAEARKWPDLMEIVERKVKGTRGSHSTAPWWQFERTRSALYQLALGSGLIYGVNCGATPHLGIGGFPSNQVFSHTIVVFPVSSTAFFAVIQSRLHELWTRFFGSSMKDDLRYTPSDCFETFPFPPGWEGNSDLEAAGKAYYEFRADLMVKNNEGLTKTYNRFHNPEERSPGILQLRQLHAVLDQAVLVAYGWTDLDTTCDFYPDYEGGSLKYRFSNETRDALLAKLLDLNARQAAGQGELAPSSDEELDCEE